MGGYGSGDKPDHKLELDTDREPWERQRFETSKAFAAFVCYRDMGVNRTVNTAAAAQRKSARTLNGWSQRWAWPRRARLWDAHCDRLVRAEKEQAIRDMVRRHSDGALDMFRIGLTEMRNYGIQIQERMKEAKAAGKPAKPLLSPKEARQLVETATRLERITHGEPTEIAEQKRTLADFIAEAAQDEVDDDE